MSDIPPKGSSTVEDRAKIYGLVRERFAQLARFLGPLHAGIYNNQGISGTLYVGELKEWLWLPERADSLQPEYLSDEDVARSRDLAVTLEHLLRDAKSVFELFLEHLDRVQPEPSFTDLVETYLMDDAALVVDAVALRGRAGKLFARRRMDAGDGDRA